MRRFTKYILLTFFIFLIIGFSFLGGAIFYKYFFKADAQQISSFQDNEFDQLFQPFFQAWEAVHNQFYDQPLDDVELMQGAIRGMLNGLNDPHSSYMNPEEYRQQNTPLQGGYTGIGAWVDTSGEYLVIISPMPNSPAEEAGIQPNDIVVAVDGTDMTGKDPATVLRYILGPEGTKVNLNIMREGESDFLDIEITRAVIEIPALEFRMLENNIAYIRLYQYSIAAAKEMEDTLLELQTYDPIGLILDLRNNAGGYLDSAIDVTSLFIQEGILMVEEWGDGTQQDYIASGNAVAADMPLVILVNEGSASASEITAGAIQDYSRGVIIGSTTFGKGLIQNWIELHGENGAIRVSVARWLTPKGRQIHENGLDPDIKVEMTDEDYESGYDPQLERAKQYFTDNSKSAN